MNKSDVIAFFDRCAPGWDADMVKSDQIIGRILDNAEVEAGQDILDVACGTGVMFPYYLERNVASVTGIDISPEMAKLAAAKFQEEEKITVICGDVEEVKLDRLFDRVVVYNAFPHFPDPKALVRTLAGLLREDGRLTIAHGASRQAIDDHHNGPAAAVSNGLMAAEDLKRILDPYFDVEILVSNRRMYQLSGVKRGALAHSHDGHTHSHAGGHSHHHHQDHNHGHAADGTPLEELLALMKYMVNHNDAHAQELSELALQLQSGGKSRAYRQIMDAVASFDMANAQLDAVLKELLLEELD